MKTREELEKTLAEVEEDERIRYKVATPVSVPLALVQVELITQANLLRWILDLPLREYD